MSNITINGKTYSGNNIQVINDQVFIDGKCAGDDFKNKDVKVIIEGDVASVESDRSVDVKGNVQGDIAAKGSVACDAVGGSVKSKGSVSCDSVGKDVKAGGSVSCGRVGGTVKAGGSVVGG